MARRTKDIWAQVDEDIWNELANRASQEGMKVKDLVVRYAIEGINQDAKGKDSNLASRIYLAVQEARKRERQITLLETLGATVIRHGEEEDLNNFTALCVEARVSIDEILDRIKQQRQPHLLPSIDSGSGVRSAMTWLQDLFSNIEVEPYQISSMQIKELGEEAGFSYATLKAAKERLNIKAKREGMKWYWMLTDE